MAHFHQLECRAGAHQPNRIARPNRSLEHAHIDDDALVAVIDRVKNQCFQRRIGVALRRGNILHHTLQDFMNVDAHLGTHARRIHAGQTNDVLHFLGNGIRVGTGQVNFVEDGDHFQIMVDGKVTVRQRLGLHALTGIHNQNGSLTGRQTAADLIRKVHMTRRVNEIKLIFLPVVGSIVHRHGTCFDGNAALTLQIHVIKDLVLHGALIHTVGQFQNTV